MKTLDMLTMLLALNDPDLVFIAEEQYCWTSLDHGSVILSSQFGKTPLSLTEYNLSLSWKRKRIPVDFMTAIQSGEIIQSEYWPEGKHIDTTDDEQVQLLTKREIVGKWYVED